MAYLYVVLTEIYGKINRQFRRLTSTLNKLKSL